MSQGEGFPQHHQAVLRTLAEHPTIQLSSDTIYPEVAMSPTGLRLTRPLSTSDTSHKPRKLYVLQTYQLVVTHTSESLAIM